MIQVTLNYVLGFLLIEKSWSFYNVVTEIFENHVVKICHQ